eukprot:TRINITY_DN7050_c0_g1_i14.p3 TRINITY_DN7050_c0_g1~~TRINITY_DN7050_c0_g1_i14.p3  ORF type:complete len:149 (-),score=34.80 TRINITY_DN7050_c0_g1_i14:734-1180(-)
MIIFTIILEAGTGAMVGEDRGGGVDVDESDHDGIWDVGDGIDDGVGEGVDDGVWVGDDVGVVVVVIIDGNDDGVNDVGMVVDVDGPVDIIEGPVLCVDTTASYLFLSLCSTIRNNTGSGQEFWFPTSHTVCQYVFFPQISKLIMIRCR